jgi:RNA polymerase sigma-70 factor (ECF subfamily)
MAIFKTELCDGLSDREVVLSSFNDIAYFACLVIRYETRLLQYIQKISQSSQEEAEDILQDGFIKIWKNIKAYDTSLTLENWIFRIIHNETISYWRKKTSFAKDHVVDIDNEKIQFLLPTDEVYDFEKDNGYKIIEEILPLLKPEYREVLVLKFFENKSYEEISDILKIPEGTVATRINRAKKSFRDLSEGKFDQTIFK